MTQETSKEINGNCPECCTKRWAEIKASYDHIWSDDQSPVSGVTHFRILKCGGCRTVYVQRSTQFSEDWYGDYDAVTGEEIIVYPEKSEFWPACPEVEHRTVPTWRADLKGKSQIKLGELLQEIYAAYSENLLTLAAIGVRTAFDCTAEVLGIDPSLTFAKKLDELVTQGRISASEKSHLDILVEAGSAAAHRGWKPSRDELAHLLDLLEQFIQRMLITDAKLTKLKKRVPRRTKAIKKP